VATPWPPFSPSFPTPLNAALLPLCRPHLQAAAGRGPLMRAATPTMQPAAVCLTAGLLNLDGMLAASAPPACDRPKLTLLPQPGRQAPPFYTLGTSSTCKCCHAVDLGLLPWGKRTALTYCHNRQVVLLHKSCLRNHNCTAHFPVTAGTHPYCFIEPA